MGEMSCTAAGECI